MEETNHCCFFLWSKNKGVLIFCCTEDSGVERWKEPGSLITMFTEFFKSGAPASMYITRDHKSFYVYSGLLISWQGKLLSLIHFTKVVLPMGIKVFKPTLWRGKSQIRNILLIWIKLRKWWNYEIIVWPWNITLIQRLRFTLYFYAHKKATVFEYTWTMEIKFVTIIWLKMYLGK